MESPKNLKEVKDQGLTGYELKTGYLLILKHGLLGTFPALITENKELFVCIDRQLLEKVWEKILKRPARVIELQLYVNQVAGIGFNVEVGDNAEPISILSEARFEEIANGGDDVFMWSPGLFSVKDSGKIESPFV